MIDFINFNDREVTLRHCLDLKYTFWNILKCHMQDENGCFFGDSKLFMKINEYKI
jgi:hypothetical protein